MDQNLINLESMKDTGNQAFKDGKLHDAERLFLEVIEAIEYMSEPVEFFGTYMAALNNLCAVYLKLEKFELVCEFSTKSLVKDNKNLKAYYRRALAKKHLLEYEEALQDVECILQYETQNKQALNLKTSITQIQSQNRSARNHLEQLENTGTYKDHLAKPFPEPKPDDEVTTFNNRTFSYKGQPAGSGGGSGDNGFMASDWTPLNNRKPTVQSDTGAATYLSTHDSEVEKAAALQSIASIQDAVKKYNAQNVKVLSKLGAKRNGVGNADTDASADVAPKSMAQALAQAKLQKKAASTNKDMTDTHPSLDVNGGVVASVFSSLQQDEYQKKQTFIDRVQRKKNVPKPSSSTKRALDDGDKLHNKPNHYAEEAVSAWDALAEEEQSKISYINEIIEEKNRARMKAMGSSR